MRIIQSLSDRSGKELYLGRTHNSTLSTSKIPWSPFILYSMLMQRCQLCKAEKGPYSSLPLPDIFLHLCSLWWCPEARAPLLLPTLLFWGHRVLTGDRHQKGYSAHWSLLPQTQRCLQILPLQCQQNDHLKAPVELRSFLKRQWLRTTDAFSCSIAQNWACDLRAMERNMTVMTCMFSISRHLLVLLSHWNWRSVTRHASECKRSKFASFRAPLLLWQRISASSWAVWRIIGAYCIWNRFSRPCFWRKGRKLWGPHAGWLRANTCCDLLCIAACRPHGDSISAELYNGKKCYYTSCAIIVASL